MANCFRENAREYYEKSRNTDRLIQCYQLLEDYDALEKMAETLPDKHPLLKEIGEIFMSVGMCSQAVTVFLKVRPLIYISFYSRFYTLRNILHALASHHESYGQMA